MTTHPHTLTFTGHLPADEMERSAMFAANPAILKARRDLEAAFEKAGHPHTSKSHVVRLKARKAPIAAEAEQEEEGDL